MNFSAKIETSNLLYKTSVACVHVGIYEKPFFLMQKAKQSSVYIRTSAPFFRVPGRVSALRHFTGRFQRLFVIGQVAIAVHLELVR